ncbi:hypothetical protein B566_EDAN004660 [Ephemera danica]|nr:hypothetical protein B566_EDAN004660 [Ephemera danica]
MAVVWQKAMAEVLDQDKSLQLHLLRVQGEEVQTLQWESPSPPSKPRKLVASQDGDTPLHHLVSENKGYMYEPSFTEEELRIMEAAEAEDDVYKGRSSNTDCYIPDGENPTEYIYNSILERCGDMVNILHVAVYDDCVYVKCNSLQDAARNLVHVKYLHLERYHDRFPAAIQATAPMQPSNSKRLSVKYSWSDK